MNRAIILKHASFEDPARIATLLRARGYELDTREVYRGDAVPRRLESGEVLIVMGGSMGVGDVGNPEFQFLQQELELLAWCAERDAPVLGVCLGAQLLAAAAGADVDPMIGDDGKRRYEVGWAPVKFLPLSPEDPLLAGVPTQANVLHWHGDMFELPRGARLLASTSLCKNQGFQLHSRLFGLQFHCEVEARDVEGFLRADLELAERANGPGSAATIRRETTQYLAALQALGDQLLGNLLTEMTDRRQRVPPKG
ncbi:MAG TPA: gamma-glutamyl-gamma-aminobutyrate hydrolase family protein [Polyangiaceae bacterium]|nr:gamma-glutamyl-gamma-aminobutyrate hydrolase family protein [Polyangiaceae bacterium]